MSYDVIFFLGGILFFTLILAAITYIDIHDRRDYIKELEKIRQNCEERVEENA